MPRDLLDELRVAGCFRILLPRSHGGLGADLAGEVRRELIQSDYGVIGVRQQPG